MRRANTVTQTMNPARIEVLVWAVVSLSSAWVVFIAQNPHIVGLFHDDGVYLAVAKSLAENFSYTIPSLPGEPFQTKYPPVYSLLLAIVWWLSPSFPESIVWLKGLNAVLVAAMLFGFGWFARRTLCHQYAATIPVLILVLGTTPGIVAFADFTMSDILFLTLTVWFFVAARRAADRDSRSRRIVLVTLIAFALLSRSIGIALVMAITLDQLMSGNLRRAALYAAAGGFVFGAWSLWAASAAGPPNPIIGYYQTYETSALGYLRSDPELARNIVIGNLRLLLDGARLVLGPSSGLWPALLLLLIIGLPATWRNGQRLALLFAAIYVAVFLLHPFAPHRYLLPLIPIFYLVVLHGVRSIAELLNSLVRTAPRLPQMVVFVAALLLLPGNFVWVRHVLSPIPNGHVRGWYGFDLGYRWEGFEETFEWIRANTGSDDRLGTIFDPMYYLYTRRQAVRPWFHHPETYFYPIEAPRPFVGRPEKVARELCVLGITHIVFDPPTGYAEGKAAIRMLRALIRLPEVNSSLVFRSSDGRHEIYRISWPKLGCGAV